MRLLIASHGPLSDRRTAGEAVMCGLVHAALQRDFSVDYVTVGTPEEIGRGHDLPPQLQAAKHRLQLREQPVPPGRTSSGVVPVLRAAMQFTNLRAPIAADWSRETYDGVIAFDKTPYLYARDVSAKRRAVIIGDPAGERLLYSSWRLERPRRLRRILVALATRASERGHWRRELKSSGWAPAMFGSQHASSWGASLSMPVMDLRPMLLRQDLPSRLRQPGRLVVAFGGSLAGTASKFAFSFFRDFFLPQLPKWGGRVVLKVVSKCEEPFISLFSQREGVELLGHVQNFEGELASADIFVFPAAYPVGVRTRICAALQAGVMCLCDPTALAGMPELGTCPAVRFIESGANALKEIQSILESDVDHRAQAQAFFHQHYEAVNSSRALLDFIAST